MSRERERERERDTAWAGQKRAGGSSMLLLTVALRHSFTALRQCHFTGDG